MNTWICRYDTDSLPMR